MDEWNSEHGRQPIQNLTSHRASISAISTGHSSSASNIAVSIAEDRMALVWHYTEGTLLRSYLLDGIPQSIAMDAADRAFFVGFQSGCVQMVPFYNAEIVPANLLDTVVASSNETAVQPSKANYWTPPTVVPGALQQLEFSAALSLSLNFDGSKLLSGHTSGRVCAWDINQGQFDKELYVLPGPVTNLACLPPHGFINPCKPRVKLHTICKPKINGNALSDINITAELLEHLRGDPESPDPQKSFSEALSQPYFPDHIVWEAIQEQQYELETRQSSRHQPDRSSGAEEFISLEDNIIMTPERQVEVLKEQLASLQRTQKESFKVLSQIRRERDVLTRQLKREDLENSTSNPLDP
jgi:pre-rRNA-processing protein IPI3